MGMVFSSFWTASTLNSPEWLSLPNDIWSQIMEKLLLEDHIRCRSVCTLWLSILRHLNRCSSQPRVPWLLIPGPHTWKFYDIASNRMMHKVNLPEPSEAIIVGSSEGWLVLADRLTADLRLFNPFTREEMQLPPTSTFPNVVHVVHDLQGRITKYGFHNLSLSCNETPQEVSRLFRSASLTLCNTGYIVVVKNRCSSSLAFARAGDKAWTALEIPGKLPYCHVLTFCRGLLYLTNEEGRVLSFDLCSGYPSHPRLLDVTPRCCLDYEISGLEPDRYWVPVPLPESGQLLLIYRCTSFYRDEKYMRAFQLDESTGRLIKVHTSSKYSLFLVSGEDPRAVTCLSGKDLPAELKGNFLYFTHDGLLRGLDMEARSITTYSSTKNCYKDKDNLFGQPDHVWVTPVLTSLSGSSDVLKSNASSSN